MPSYNHAVLLGHLCFDTELRTGGKATVATNTVATNRKAKDGSETASFIPIVAFHDTARRLHEWGAKGRLILVDGTIHQENWTGPDGKPRSRLVVWISRFTMADRPPGRPAGAEDAGPEDGRGKPDPDEVPF